MKTLTDTSPAATPVQVSRDDVMAIYAAGGYSPGTAAMLRTLAADPRTIEDTAAEAGTAPEHARAAALAVADAIDALGAEDSTPDCPKAGDGGSHSIAWHQGGTCAFCGASRAAIRGAAA